MDKKRYRSSNIIHYFTCPFKYKLSLEHPIETNDAMREGLLFEGYVFNKFKENNETELIGRKKKDTIDAIKQKADFIRTYFLQGEPFRKLSLEYSDYIITGEADYIGIVNYNGTEIECIADLKFTGDINIWNRAIEEGYKSNFIQAVLYTYLYYKETNKILPFIYFVVEKTYDKPLIKPIKIIVTEKDFKFITDTIDKIHNDDFMYCNANYGTCIQGKYGRCDYLEFCDEGRKFIADKVEINFSNLN